MATSRAGLGKGAVWGRLLGGAAVAAMVAVLGMTAPAVAQTPSPSAMGNSSAGDAAQPKKFTASSDVTTQSLVTWIHSDARVTSSTHVGDYNFGDDITPICYVFGDSVGGSTQWTMIYDATNQVGGFVSSLYTDNTNLRFCGDTGEQTGTSTSAVWSHSRPYVSAPVVATVGGTSDLREYYGTFGDYYGSSGMNIWYLVFDPGVFNGRAGFVHCSDLTAFNLHC